jgi:hypothetical protein
MTAWPLRPVLLVAAAVPAFSGWPLERFSTPLVSGVSAGWLGYLVLVHLLAAPCAGLRRYGDILALTALITVPVVYGGAVVAYGWNLAAGAPPGAAGPHYLGLCVRMLTVVPLALALVAQIPFQRLERGMLVDGRGVGRGRKTLLMVLRVFTHIVYFVVPDMLEVVREERAGAPRPARRRGLQRLLVDLAVAAICAALRYIPLWAVEIAALPEPGQGPKPQDPGGGPAGG